MVGLDQFLTDQTFSIFDDRLREISNPENWTKENRDDMFDQIIALKEDIVAHNLNVIHKLCSSLDSNNEHTNLYHLLSYEALSGLVSIILRFRESLDMLDEKARSIDTFTYDWLNSKLQLSNQAVLYHQEAFNFDQEAADVEEV